jgi:hypothetical protein
MTTAACAVEIANGATDPIVQKVSHDSDLCKFVIADTSVQSVQIGLEAVSKFSDYLSAIAVPLDVDCQAWVDGLKVSAASAQAKYKLIADNKASSWASGIEFMFNALKVQFPDGDSWATLASKWEPELVQAQLLDKPHLDKLLEYVTALSDALKVHDSMIKILPGKVDRLSPSLRITIAFVKLVA